LLDGDWPNCFPCNDAPAIYGVLATPDLVVTPDDEETVDSSDIALFATYLGQTVTKVFGWQANFNHAGATIDAGDLAYFSGRLYKSCSSSKAGAGSGYQMEVRNLLNPELEALMATHSITKSQVVAIWEANGWTYDREAAGKILAGTPSPIARELVDWGKVKTHYR
jgi:hypothetical protein